LFVLYDILMECAVWALLVPWELLRKGGASLRERLGTVRSREVPAVLVHAVSAGEVAAASSLIAELQSRGERVVLSVGNAAGRSVATRLQKTYPSLDAVVWLPWDRRRAVRRWLRALNIRAVAVVETELWPNLFRACRDEGVRLVIVNGRVIPRDVSRYRLVGRFLQRVLALPNSICVQDEEERARFIAIGADPARIDVAGNLKIDSARAIPPTDPHRRTRTIVAGSTHAEDEALILDAFAQLRATVPDVRLVLVPRHPHRATRLRGDIARRDFRRDAVQVVDRFGLLARAYAACDVAIIGGSFSATGAHNPLEAIQAGAAVIVGPVHGALVETFASAAAISVVSNASTLAAELVRLFTDDAARERQAATAQDLLGAMSGSASRQADAVLG
jgi:3-deoxy-D-manno-octulosonic-acid transferase